MFAAFFSFLFHSDPTLASTVLRSGLWEGPSMTAHVPLFFYPGVLLVYWQRVWDHCHDEKMKLKNIACWIKIRICFSAFTSTATTPLAEMQPQSWGTLQMVINTIVPHCTPDLLLCTGNMDQQKGQMYLLGSVSGLCIFFLCLKDMTFTYCLTCHADICKVC